MVNKTPEELSEMRAEIAAGTLPPDAIKQYYADERRYVFGFDYKVDRNNKPIEQGIGSPGNQTENSIAAYKKYHANDVDYERMLARLQKELDESNARRAAERRIDQ
jgi:hypothetical protein